MQASDTVQDFDDTILITVNSLLEAQAEITWDKAIREVMDFTTREFGFDWSEEKEQLEKWGIK